MKTGLDGATIGEGSEVGLVREAQRDEAGLVREARPGGGQDGERIRGRRRRLSARARDGGGRIAREVHPGRGRLARGARRRRRLGEEEPVVWRGSQDEVDRGTPMRVPHVAELE